MAQIKITIPDFGDDDGANPIIILGPNGSGKTQIAQQIAKANTADGISAQRRTWADDSLPVQEEQNLLQQLKTQQDQWHRHPWQPTDDINFILSKLIQEHTNQLTALNERAIELGQAMPPVDDTKLIILQGLWSRLFPTRKLEIGGFFPKVRRLDTASALQPYELRRMSDGERTVLYMAARVLTTDKKILVVDEPELHMHSRLAVHFWDEAEKLREDCRFVYVTHDLNFALSRRNPTVLVARSNARLEAVIVDQLPTATAAEVLGAATLPFYARRIFFYEGEEGKGFASEFFSKWFDGHETFAVAAGNRDAVCAAVTGLKRVGVAGATVGGLVDRDYYSDPVLKGAPEGVQVLMVHEVESLLCDQDVVSAIATYFGRDPAATWNGFLARVREEFCGKTLSIVIARRVRARVSDLVDGAFDRTQIAASVGETRQLHADSIVNLNLSEKAHVMFSEEEARVQNALIEGGREMLAILPGKHLLKILTNLLGLKHHDELTGLVVRALNRRALKSTDPLLTLGNRLELALLSYLPERQIA